MKKKGDIDIDKIIKWIIGLLVLAIAIIFILILSGRGSSLLEKIINLFKFGR